MPDKFQYYGYIDISSVYIFGILELCLTFVKYFDRYQNVIYACGLEPDFAILDDGDETEVYVLDVLYFGPVMFANI